ncbi:MAG: hypothetical protein GF335_02840 [Candidatus Moranbacteria bacterium]|nr:hypothetical protein [Candidatus Moranbacteria bacterium]
MAEKFLSADDFSKKIPEWKLKSMVFEGEDKHQYVANRYENRIGYSPTPENKFPSSDIKVCHGISFIDDIIKPSIEKRDNNNPKYTILDIGAGIGLYAEQLRKEFGNNIKVFSTGLRKKPAIETRGKISQVLDFFDGNINKKLHPNDLKWRSIAELSDFEEFDLMIDTFGEFEYSISTIDDLTRYLTIGIKKLRENGVLSIATTKINCFKGELEKQIEELNTILNKFSNINFKIEKSSNNIIQIRIQKGKKL